MLFEQRRQARQALLRGITADAGVDYRRLALPFVIEQGGPGRAGRHAIACAEAVAENQ